MEVTAGLCFVSENVDHLFIDFYWWNGCNVHKKSSINTVLNFWNAYEFLLLLEGLNFALDVIILTETDING